MKMPIYVTVLYAVKRGYLKKIDLQDGKMKIKKLIGIKLLWQQIQQFGKYITYNGEPINALFHSNSGGKTEIPINVWGGDYPYLVAVETSGEEGYSTYNSEVVISKDELIAKVLEKYPNFKIDFNAPDCIQILDYTDSGRVKTLKLRKYTNFRS